ncbi:vacuolar protein sorting-associated protein 37B-like [Scleropages formosus]|uniref:Vacuolar protein sorting-associated protein 37B-like n=1 Tax=Scleropages formosus TaxID=113540 RepID=A0A8C9TAT5_SCLFO|nr:vacuolar protein sorting-associated protein 37B-like [Scleropages formosus]
MAGLADKFASFSLTQLNGLLEDDEQLHKIVTELEEVQQVQQSKEMTLASNRRLAEQNLQLQPQLDCQKNELTKRYRQLQEVFELYQLHKSTLDHETGNLSLDTLLALLQAEGAKIEEETEIMADSFLEGGLTLDSFIDEYQNKRKLAHLRRVKIDKLQEMALREQRLPQTFIPNVRPQETPSIPLAESSGPPTPLPRRAPPPPPPQASPALQPVPGPYTAVLPYPAVPYPPVPPRVGRALSGQNPGYPNPFESPYPPPLPQRPSPRIIPQPGFIMQ